MEEHDKPEHLFDRILLNIFFSLLIIAIGEIIFLLYHIISIIL